MADTPTGPPPGAVAGDPVQGPPSGAVAGDPEEFDQSPEAVAARHARSREGKNFDKPPITDPVARLVDTQLHTALDLGTGVAKEGLKTIQGVERGANWAARKLDPLDSPEHPTPQLPILAEAADTELHGAAEKVGGNAENVAEWAAGDEALKAIGKLVQMPRSVLALLEKYPKGSKIVLDSLRSVGVGGAQGAVKEGTEGAKEGAVAGGAGGTVGSLLAEGFRPLARIMGLGGLTSEEAFTKAGRPHVADINWKDSLEKAMPVLKTLDFKDVSGFVDAVHDSAKDLWEKTIQPQVDRNANAMINGSPIAKLIRSAKNNAWTALQNTFGKENQAVEGIAQDFDNFQFNLKDANEILKVLNAKLADFYNMPSIARHAAGITDGEIAGLEKASNGLRDHIYGTLANAGEETPREFRQQYGALKDIGRVFGRRATVEERQSPLSLKMFMSLLAGAGEMLAAFRSGEPLAAAGAAVPIGLGVASTARGTSKSLIKQGIGAAEREALGEDITKSLSTPNREAVKTATKVGAGAGATEAALPEDQVRFKASDGSIHSVPREQLEAAKKIDPELEVIE